MALVTLAACGNLFVCGIMGIIVLVRIMLQILLLFYSKFLLKSVHYVHFYSFYAYDFIITVYLQINYHNLGNFVVKKIFFIQCKCVQNFFTYKLHAHEQI